MWWRNNKGTGRLRRSFYRGAGFCGVMGSWQYPPLRAWTLEGHCACGLHVDGVLLLLPNWVSAFESEFRLFQDVFKFRGLRMSASFNILLISHHVRCELKWVIWVGQITQTQHLSKDYKSEWVVVCLHSTRGEITYGEGDASTPKGWCRHRQRALLTSRSDRSWRGLKSGAFLKPRKC